MNSNKSGFLGSLRNSARTSALTLAACMLFSSVTVAAAPAAGPDRDKWHQIDRFDVKTPWSDTNAGAARGNVDAPVDVVRSVVLDYKNYASFISRFEKSRVVGKSGDKTDVYLQVPILKGAAKVWAIVRFEPPKQLNGSEVVEGHMIKGNVKHLDATWRLKKLDDSSTQVVLELLIVPDMPVPDSLVVPEVRYAAAKAVEGSRDEAEKRKPH
ncbi:MAG TPA: SRPBCC family protein [Polyangiaceae bacterium]|jgi:ribosome-associated toxin RatA of RatAB toxin-antitoxin module|nr:SRPBCC family protein [Polyangiaceae bacterium]